MKKIHKFIIGGIIFGAIIKIPYLKYQTFDFAGLIGLIIAGVLFGLIAYGIFGRKRKSANSNFGTSLTAEPRIQQVVDKKIKMVKQHPAVIKAAILIILSKDLLALILGFLFMQNDTQSSTQTIGMLFWDLFFCYHLAKMKEWARKWTIARTILGMIIIAASYLSTANYFGLSIDIPILCCVLILLLGVGSKKKAVIVTSVYGFLFVGLIVLTIWGGIVQQQSKRIIQSSPILMEQKSEAGFKVILPSNEWRFLKKEDSMKLIGNFTKNVNIVITDTSGTIFGTFLGEDLSGIDKSKLDMEALLDNIKKTVIGKYKVANESKYEDGILIESQYVENGSEGVYTYVYKIFDKTGVVINFFGELEKYNKLKKDIFKIIADVQEVSRKEFLPKIPSREIYSKNSDAVVIVRIYDQDGKVVGFSSGFNILKEGVIITNLHTIMAGYYMDVKFPQHGVYEEVYITGLSNTLHDLVILKLNGKDLPFVNLEDSMEIEVGDKVVAISNPEGLTNSISEGIISGLRNIEGYPYYQMTAPISQGSSGGAVFNEFGNIIGIASASLESGQNLNFCIPISELGNFKFFENLVTLSQFQEAVKELQEKQ